MLNNFPKQIFYLPVIAITTFFLALFLYTKFVGSIPFSATFTTTTKTDLFQVTGEGKVTAVPDIAQVNLGITVSRSTVKAAQEEANRVINKITDGLKKLGVAEKDIKTTNYSLHPDYDWTEGKQRVTGYQVTINLEVKIRKFEKINEVIDLTTAEGANLIGGLSFTVDEEKLKDLQVKARQEAVKVAKEKAESLAKAAGIKLGRIVNVQENIVSPWEPRPFMALEKAAGAPEEKTQVQPGESEIRVSATLSYEIRD